MSTPKKQEVPEEHENFIVKFIMMLLSPGVNSASLILLNMTLVMEWIFIIVSLFYRYYNIHVYILGFLTTALVLFVNFYAPAINEAVNASEEKKND
ncbi:uncharacterized protein [Blastocystis hominis]|uniref:Uncharacterized protein n=1 Tax=Blastocystis hominis TaxID=12968 RepID=D8M9Q2_BLAHO|nr:uncharacterized protein [Blastocystis hominis]CBK24791.2 unnamed protein product [Blastocystis hominis]|eukprot:XP_012898839.1 uncharacterized protein [Blastocystis hominis]